MKVTYYGHSSLGIEIKGIHLIVDPFISGNPKAGHIDINTLKADFILLTHAHSDHVLDVEALARRTGAQIIANHEIVTYYEKVGLQGHGMNHGGSFDFSFGRVKMVNAIHSSSFPDGTYGGNPGGFVIEADKTIYIAGDTALTMDMKLIPFFHQLHLAVLPIGGNFTMDVEEAVIAADFIDCDNILGVHYDTFEWITIGHEMAISRFMDKKKTLNLLAIGESMEV